MIDRRKTTGWRPSIMTTRSYDYGTCPGCGGVYTITKAGKVRAHNRDYERCSGSGKSPVEP